MKSDKLVIAFTCVGRRVQLVRHFRLACERMGLQAYLIGLDTDPERAPAAYFCDESLSVPHGSHPDFGAVVLDVVADKNVQMLVPLADPDLPAVGRIRSEVTKLGCLPAYSGPQTMAIAADKLETYRFLRDNGLHTPRTRLLSDVLEARGEPVPFFIKQRDGSAGKNTLTARSWALPDWVVDQADQFIWQELLEGQEVTVDLLIDEGGQPHCAVPRLRLEIRGGEVMKSMVRMDATIIDQACAVAKALPDGFGAINIQGFIQPGGRVSWTEINARFGGGSPLAIEAGATYPDLLAAMCLGHTVAWPVRMQDGMTMLRFDDAIYVAEDGTACRGSDVRASSRQVAAPQSSAEADADCL